MQNSTLLTIHDDNNHFVQWTGSAAGIRATRIGIAALVIILFSMRTIADDRPNTGTSAEGEPGTAIADDVMSGLLSVIRNTAVPLNPYPQVPLGWRKVPLEFGEPLSLADDPTTPPIEPTPDAGVAGRNQPQTGSGEEEPPDCAPWDGETVYCDVIDGTVIILGTADSEKIWIDDGYYDYGSDTYFIITILVTHSDGSTEWFELDYDEFLASAGIFRREDAPPGFIPTLYIDARCGDDVVVNRVGFESFATLGAGNDVYVGGWRTDIVDGEWDNDTIFGGHGADDVCGGTGSDLLAGGEAPYDFVSSPGDVKWEALHTLSANSMKELRVDTIDCGMDSNKDWIFVELATGEDGATYYFDNVINRDWSSPPGTDEVNP